MSKLVGILNITPDSFSDGGDHLNPSVALDAARQLLADGADIIDIGAESTRPGAAPLHADEEWARLDPVLSPIIALTHDAGKLISIDTRHPATAAKAVALGVDWLNDVGGLVSEEMLRVASSSKVKLVLMHSLSIPANPSETLPDDCDVMELLLEWGSERLEALAKHGIRRRRIILDPGIGFGKTPKQSFEIISHANRFAQLGADVMFGHSRKSFLKIISDKAASERDELTQVISAMLMLSDVTFLRVHDVKGHARIRKALYDK